MKAYCVTFFIFCSKNCINGLNCLAIALHSIIEFSDIGSFFSIFNFDDVFKNNDEIYLGEFFF